MKAILSIDIDIGVNGIQNNTVILNIEQLLGDGIRLIENRLESNLGYIDTTTRLFEVAMGYDGGIVVTNKEIRVELKSNLCETYRLRSIAIDFDCDLQTALEKRCRAIINAIKQTLAKQPIITLKTETIVEI